MVDIASQFLALDSNGFTLEHRASFFPTGVPRPVGHPDRRAEHHLCGGSLPVRQGVISSHLYLIGPNLDHYARYAIQQRFGGLCKLALRNLPADYAAELLKQVTDPVHRWLLAVHVVSKLHRMCVHHGIKTHHGDHDGRFPTVPCYSEISPVGAASANAMELLEANGDEWSEPLSPSDWGKRFKFSAKTFIRRVNDGTIRVRKLTSKSYKVHMDDLPSEKRR